MKRFSISILLLFLCVAGSAFIMFSLTDGYSDPYYLKLTSPKQSNLILGTSKAAQGIQPAVLEEKLHKSFFNYAFSNYSSPYGSIYFSSIKEKLDTTKKNNIFILTVDTWSICSRTKNPNDTINFRERDSFLHTIKNVNQLPNYKYLINYFDGNYYKIFTKSSPAFLHDNGWLEVNLNNDTEKANQRKTFTINDYNEKLKFYNYSEIRYNYLLKTISYLKRYGKVYLVKLPIHPDLNEIETKILPDFNTVIQTAVDQAEGYFDMQSFNSTCSYTDGVHLTKESGKQITATIANLIKKLEEHL